MSVVGKVAEMPVKELAAELINDHDAATNDKPKDDDKPKDEAPGTEVQGNAAAKGTGKVAILGSEIDFHFVVVGGHMYVSLPGAGWADYGHPTRPYSVTSLLSLDEGLANVLNNFVDPKVEGRETVSDHQAIRVSGKVTPVAVNKFIPQLGATDRMPATVWIQEGGDRQVVEISLEPSTDNFVQLAFSDWNSPVTIEKPPGV